ncbi:YugN family protein [Cohnella zeiphila]|uniref:YugN-like family protein n=1 Tax=Cohnella zeiphila TaxID=2761120 RepID=A0A7X0SJR3_9BACL|nr:YugN family protein [Cohnella zeiphila]MBB6731156.1 hypothetical protein [Cohnella zeiphila]
MIPLHSRLTSSVRDYRPVRDALTERGFALGGAWDYDNGSFDCALDEENKVWLRLPFQVTDGHLDGESPEADAQIRFGSPFVLKHLYNEGLDAEAQPRTMGALFDQFQDPVDADAEIEPQWVDKARRRLQEAESACLP